MSCRFPEVRPEELPLVMTIFFALGAFRLSTKNVLVRRSSIIETLGAATVLCSDKTGTITQNKMKIGIVVTESETVELNPNSNLSEEIKNLLHIAYCASKHPSFDPMDIAISDCLVLFHEREDSALLSVQDFPLTPEGSPVLAMLKLKLLTSTPFKNKLNLFSELLKTIILISSPKRFP